MANPRERICIVVMKTTHARLSAHGKKGDSFDAIIQKLLNAQERK